MRGSFHTARRPFFGIFPTRLRYTLLPEISAGPAEEVAAPRKAFYFVDQPYDGARLRLAPGTPVRRGEPLAPFAGIFARAIATVSGVIESVTPAVSPRGRKVTRIAVASRQPEEWDEGLGKTPDLEKALCYLGDSPGGLDLPGLTDPFHAIHCLVVLCADQDLMVTSTQQVAMARSRDVALGIAALKEMTGIGRVEAAIPKSMAKTAAAWEVPVKVLSSSYPEASPALVLKRHYNVTPAAGAPLRRYGFGFASAEAVAAVGAAFRTGRPRGEKVLTLIPKDLTERPVNFRVRVGTPVRDVLAAGRVVVRDGDRVILGGPLTGYAAADLDEPVTPVTSAVMIEDADRLAAVDDAACMNCGECVRICPARVPVNMLIRYLEGGLWDEAARRYDLLSCLDCGLCSLVCPARIPVFQHIALGKLEYEKTLAVKD